MRRFVRHPMSGDAGGCARSWPRDRLRRPIAKRPRHSSTPGLAAKAGLRSFAGHSTADDRTPCSKPPVVGSTRPFDEAEPLLGREPLAARFPCAYVFSARVRSSRPCGARGFSNMAFGGESALCGEYSMVISSSFPVSRHRGLDTRTEVNLRRRQPSRH